MSDYLIWSNQQTAWWRPAERGYTQSIEEAGRYDKPTAERIVARATCDGMLLHTRTNPVTGESYEQFDEVLVLAPDAAEPLRSDAETPAAEHPTQLPSFEKLMAAQELLSRAREVEQAAGHPAVSQVLNSFVISLFQLALMEDAESVLAATTVFTPSDQEK